MPAYIAKKLVQKLIQKGKNPQDAKVLMMGITFKENVSDIRNSKVADLVRELMKFSINVHISDPYASPNEVAHEYKLTLVDNISNNYDAIVVAVAHEEYKNLEDNYFNTISCKNPILMDLKGILNLSDNTIDYWRL
jgi:UDP-N-acetyl-D-galactosamine dehydrogenase